MSPEDKTRLAKVLNLTQSNIDGEALSAIRKGNSLLKKYNTDWVSFINGAVDNNFFGLLNNVGDAYKRGRQQGYNEGHTAGQLEGLRVGREKAYSAGYAAAKELYDTDIEPVKMFRFVLQKSSEKDWEELSDVLIDLYIKNGGEE
jgi:hypothetical protein